MKRTVPVILLLTFITALQGFPADSSPAELPEMVIQMGHNYSIKVLNFSNDGRYLVSAALDGFVKLWHVETGKLIRTLAIGTGTEFHNAVFSPNDAFVAAGGMYSSRVLLLDTKTGNLVHSLVSDAGGNIFSLAFTKDGRYLAAGGTAAGSDRAITIWDVSTGEKLVSFEYNVRTIKQLVFSPDNYSLYSAGEYESDGEYRFRVKKWNWKTGEEIRIVGDSSDYICITRDGQYLIKAINEQYMQLVDIGTNEIKKTCPLYAYVQLIQFSPDYRYYITYYQTLIVYDAQTDTKLHSLEEGHYPLASGMYSYHSVCISGDSRLMASCSNEADPEIILWDLAGGNIIRRFSGNTDAVFTADYMPKAKKMIFGDMSGKSPKVWNLDTVTLEYLADEYKTEEIECTADEQYFFTIGNKVRLWETQSLRELWSQSLNGFDGDFSPDGKRLAYCSYNSAKDKKPMLRLYDTVTQDIFWERPVDSILEYIEYLKNGDSIVFCGEHMEYGGADEEFFYSSVMLVDAKNGKELWKFNSGRGFQIQSLADSPSGNYIAFSVRMEERWKDRNQGLERGVNRYWIEVWDITRGIMSSIANITKPAFGSISALAFTEDEQLIIAGYASGEIVLWNWKDKTNDTMSRIKTLGKTSGLITFLKTSPDGRFLYSGSYDGTIRVWDLVEGGYVAFLSNSKIDQWLVYTHDGYWDSSREGGELLSMVRGMEVWSIDQFAVRNNRPDIILKRLDSKDKNLIDHYYRQYKKRIKRLGFNENQLSDELHVPAAKIIERKQEGKTVNLTFSLNDSKYNLKNYNIYVNDVPVFGAYGRAISGKARMITEQIELASGRNKIEISCMNEKGAESYRALAFSDFGKQVKGDLYFIGFGVSKYKNSELNLNYADKDVKDLAGIFESMRNYYNKVYVKTYLNEEVTPLNIRKAKEILKNAKVDDTFVLFISGHGMHDRDQEATYYYLAHNTDLNNLKGTAANFELIEELVQGIAPRKKLILMDTCESGEVEDNTQKEYYVMADAKGIRARTTKKGVLAKPAQKRTWLYEKDRYIYNDLLRRSGAIIFSSCKGGEFSYESDKFANGLFTEEIINALAKRNADADRDGIVTTNELRDYVIKAVPAHCRGMQNPTIDRDNIYVKFGFIVGE
ncbi:MAG: caspase family protein [Spirochaetales bacterium]|nr:caspase family protein [Spirochaetales bacterium]